MVKIRLRRMGAKKAPFYRIVVADSRFARGADGFSRPCVHTSNIVCEISASSRDDDCQTDQRIGGKPKGMRPRLDVYKRQTEDRP